MDAESIGHNQLLLGISLLLLDTCRFKLRSSEITWISGTAPFDEELEELGEDFPLLLVLPSDLKNEDDADSLLIKLLFLMISQAFLVNVEGWRCSCTLTGISFIPS